MRERIILAPGGFGTELQRSMARCGISSINLRILNAVDLAQTALMREGILVDEGFLSLQEETALICKLIEDKKIPYFEKSTYTDVVGIVNALHTARSLITAEDEQAEFKRIMADGIFENKNSALISLYDEYIKTLKEKKVLDTIMLVKKAIAECSEMSSTGNDNTLVFSALDEYPLNPMEKALLEKVSGCKYQRTSLADLLGGESEKKVVVEKYYNCYGIPNEVDKILSVIYEGGSGMSLDKCTVAVTDPMTYAQIFYELAIQKDIPMTFGTGIPIINSYPGRLLELYYHWMTNGLFSAYSMKEMLLSPYFDRHELVECLKDSIKEHGGDPEKFQWHAFLELLTPLCLTNNEEKNKEIIKNLKKALEAEKMESTGNSKKETQYQEKQFLLPAVEFFAYELADPCECFIGNYAKHRTVSGKYASVMAYKLDKDAEKKIYDQLSQSRAAELENSDEIIKNLLYSMAGMEMSSDGALHVTSVKGAMAVVRQNLFVAGLMASKFPGNPQENYLLLDDDLAKFGPGSAEKTSEGRVEGKKKDLWNLLRVTSKVGGKIYLSYSGIDVAELKNDNASAMLYEIYNEDCGGNTDVDVFEKNICKVAYFEPNLLRGREIGKAYLAGNQSIQTQTVQSVEKKFSGDLEKVYSPSVLRDYFKCPRKFLLKQILGIQEPEEDTALKVILGTETGTLAHDMMEILGADRNMQRSEFLKRCEEHFDRFLLTHTPIIKKDADDSRKDFRDMMNNAFDMELDARKETQGDVLMMEQDIQCVHDCGLKIHGFPDRVERLLDGTYRVVDFKTGRRVEHIQDDVTSCIQALIYAYILENYKTDENESEEGGQASQKKPIKVSVCEFRYPRLKERITCSFDAQIKSELSNKLKAFMKDLKAGNFEIPKEIFTDEKAEKETCAYCKYADICGKRPWEGADK